MFDIGWQELFVIAVLALIVVGPKDLPKAIRTITTWVRKARMMARDFQSGVNEMVREAELDDIKDQLTKPHDLKKAFTDTVDPDGAMSKGLNLDEKSAKKPGPVPIKSSTDAAADDETDPYETGEPHQFVNPMPPADDDVMPIPASAPPASAPDQKKSKKNAESKS